MLSAISHHLSHISNYILPDSVSALPLLAAFLCLTLAMRYQKSARLIKQTYMLYALAGLMLGFAAWLRSQTMLLAFFLLVMLALISMKRIPAIKRAALMALVSVLTRRVSRRKLLPNFI
jgi:4-amino-4-deoxy-L-arabinose transferase-like glycosyltransferase